MPPELTVASTEAWPYEVLRRVGQGASANVWLARGTGESLVALKVAHRRRETSRFASEALRLALAQSPALPALAAVGLVPSRSAAALGLCEPVPFLALEWVTGSALEPRALSGSERVELVLVVARDVGRALADLHAAGLAHGDIKPSNILHDAQLRRARVVDLGLADDASRAHPAGGTPRYLAPEHRIVGSASDARARDAWALGVTLAELADAAVAGSTAPGKEARERRFDERLELLIRPLLRDAAGARPAAEWVHRMAHRLLGTSESPEQRRARATASLRRAYLSVRRPWLDHVLRGDALDLRVTGLAERWLREAATTLAQIARLGEGLPAPRERRRHLVEDLGPLDQERLLIQLLGASGAHGAAWRARSDAELLERIESWLEEEGPHPGWGWVHQVTARAPAAAHEDPVELAIALCDSPPPLDLLERAEAFVTACPASRSLGLLVARCLRLRGELGRALALFDLVGGPEANAEAAETARRAGDDGEALRRLEAIDANRVPDAVRAQCAATAARIELQAGDVAAALRRLEGALDGFSTLEVRSLVCIRQNDLGGAERCVLRARAHARTSEERARLEFLVGRIAHARHAYAAALASFVRAAEHAVRAGAVLEEATYSSGVAASAAELGEMERALAAAERAWLLFEHLGRPGQAARAALSRAGVLVTLGAREEAVEAASEALQRARHIGDRRCQAYAHLALAEARLDDAAVALPHLEQARTLVGDDAADALRIAALALLLGAEVDVGACDARASESGHSAEARLAWWGARAERWLDTDPPLRAPEVVRQLGLLVSAHAAVGVLGPAFAAGARLAARSGEADLSHRFTAIAKDAALTLRRSAPAGLAQSFSLQPWVLGLEERASPRLVPDQVREIENLVRALSTRESLKALLAQVLDALVLWTGVERGLFLLRAPGGRLVPRVARNLARADLNAAQIELSRSLAERAIDTREPVVAVDAAGELPELHRSVHALKLRSVLAIPLFFRGETLGVVYLDDRVRTGAFGPEELSWVRLVASIASVAIGEARDQLSLRRAVRRAKRAELRLAASLSESEARRDLAERQLSLRDAESTRHRYQHILGESTAIQQLLAVLDRVMPTEVPVLILGESGSGKELVARALHEHGPRAARPFVSENCSAIPETLLESTLFGHVRGAFTGAAKNQAGLFSLAHQGTLFLDEIGEMSLGMQAKLLRVLQSGEVRPLGSDRCRVVDVRVIGATARNLEEMVERGSFREDLYYRLNVVSLRVPPLRERRSDILLLMHHFLAKHASGDVPALSDRAAACLMAYAWPGNVRELENEARRALVMAGDVIRPEHFSLRVQGQAPHGSPPGDFNLRARVDKLESELVQAALERTEGNQTRAAELLGLSRFGLQKMMKRLHIDRARG